MTAFKPLPRACRRCRRGCQITDGRQRYRENPDRNLPRVGLVIGGGGIKAAAHIGVIEVLREAGIPIDLVAGSSAGALVGSFQCSGYSPRQMRKIMFQEFRGGGIWKWFPGGKYLRLAHMLRFRGLKKLIARHIPAKNLADFKTPFMVSTTDVKAGTSLVLDQGPTELLMLASMSIPGLSPPIAYRNHSLIDGSILNDLPVKTMREKGADLVIAVDLSSLPSEPAEPSNKKRPPRVSQFRFRSVNRALALQRQFLAETRAADADVIVRPQVGDYSLADFDRMDDLIELGRQAAFECVPAILKLFRQTNAPPNTVSINNNTSLPLLAQPSSVSQ